MLEEFIEKNGLDAKLLPLDKEIRGYTRIAALAGVPEKNVLRTVLYINSANEPFLAVFPAHAEPDIDRLCALAGCVKAMEASDDESEEITGYKNGVMPPISVYGIKTIVDSSVPDMDRIACFAGRRDTALVMKAGDIIESAWENPVVGEITQD
jgi:prolyl-tRNA editing enzyme YbaK/EbsC (Cys-tRNA(Pro) deacylase)